MSIFMAWYSKSKPESTYYINSIRSSYTTRLIIILYYENWSKQQSQTVSFPKHQVERGKAK